MLLKAVCQLANGGFTDQQAGRNFASHALERGRQAGTVLSSLTEQSNVGQVYSVQQFVWKHRWAYKTNRSVHRKRRSFSK